MRIWPLPFTVSCPLRRPTMRRISGLCCTTSWAAVRDIWMRLGRLLLSMREAVFTVSPNRQKRGFMLPTTEATTAPE